MLSPTSRVVRPLARSLKASLIFLIGNLAIGSLPLSKERKATRHVIAQHPGKGLRDLVREPRNLVRAKSEWLSASDWNPCPRHPGARTRTPRLFEVAREAGAKGDAIALLEAFSGEVDKAYGRHLTINATGALAALMLEIGIAPEIMRAIAVTSRAAGLTAHIAEEQRSPSGRRIWTLVENAFAYTGP
jgi:hypothetical protein